MSNGVRRENKKNDHIQIALCDWCSNVGFVVVIWSVCVFGTMHLFLFFNTDDSQHLDIHRYGRRLQQSYFVKQVFLNGVIFSFTQNHNEREFLSIPQIRYKSGRTSSHLHFIIQSLFIGDFMNI